MVFFLQGKLETALQHYDNVLKKIPGSARAVYGRARVFDQQSEKLRSNKMLGEKLTSKYRFPTHIIFSLFFIEQSIEEYLKVLDNSDAPKQLKIEAGRRCADRQTFRGLKLRKGRLTNHNSDSLLQPCYCFRVESQSGADAAEADRVVSWRLAAPQRVGSFEPDGEQH